MPPGAHICFFYRECGQLAACEKQGKFLCGGCAGKIPGDATTIRTPWEMSHGCLASELAYDLWMYEP